MIGILTFQATNNFGAHLHAIALQRKIQQLGYECEIIDYLSPELVRRETASFKVDQNIKSFISYLLWGRIIKKKYDTLHRELRTYARVGDIKYYPETIKESNNHYDTFLLGSDVLWSLRVSNEDLNYFLAFVDENKNKFSFSTSVGETHLYKDNIKLPTLLRRFSIISVREEEAVKWVNDISGKDAYYVCDPTMLFNQHEWDDIISPINYKSDYVLMYFPDTEGKMYKDAEIYAKKFNLKIKYIHYGRTKLKCETIMPTSLAEFVGLIKCSKAFFTASYHGLLFGLYYHIEVFYYNRSFKSRMGSLAKLFMIEDHNGDNFSLSVNKIDYGIVDNKIEKFRNYSTDILKSILSNC